MSVPAALLAGAAYHWLVRRGDPERRRRGAEIAVQVVAFAVPITLDSMKHLNATLLPRTAATSPEGLALTAGIGVGALLAIALLVRLLSAVVRFSFAPIAAAGFGLVALASGMVALGARGGASTASGRPNVLLISIDSLRKDTFDQYLAAHASPTLRRFVAGARRWDGGHTTFSQSLPSHASMLTGLYPHEHGALLFGRAKADLGSGLFEHVETLADVFRDAGYETLAVVSNHWLGPPYGLESGFQTWVNYGEPATVARFDLLLAANVSVLGPYLRYAERRLLVSQHPDTRLFVNWLAGRDRARPFFAFLHYLDMHTPSTPPPVYRRRFCAGRLADVDGRTMKKRIDAGEFTPEEMVEVREHLRRLHMADLAQMDDFLSPVLEALADGGWLEDTLVAIVSDHGEELYEHEAVGSYGKSHVYESSTRIPFLLHVPGDAQGSLHPGLASHVDLAPTFYAFAGVAPPARLSGIDLRTQSRRPGAETDFILLRGWDYKNGDFAHAVIFANGRKFLRDGAGNEIAFDLDRDPGELDPKPVSAPTVDGRQRERFQQLVAAATEAEAEPIGLDELPDAAVDRLRALGYVR
jgi:arylsulfatase A-like enzyme